jgi:hypothetical protein
MQRKLDKSKVGSLPAKGERGWKVRTHNGSFGNRNKCSVKTGAGLQSSTN